MQFEQGALDSLYSAKLALQRAIDAYEGCRERALNPDYGPLFEVLDNLATVVAEVNDFHSIALK